MYLACPATISFLAICGAAIAHFVGQRIKKNVVVVVGVLVRLIAVLAKLTER